MADRYCKKSSLEAVADEVRTRAGLSSSNKLTPAQMKTTIDNLEIPVQRGNPSVTLTGSSPSYTIQKGVYTGGTVSVTGQSKTATLSQNGSTVTPDGGKVLTSVTVPAKNAYSVATGTITPAANVTSVTITTSSFSPVGVCLQFTADGTVSSYLKSPYFCTGIFLKDGTIIAASGVSSSYYGVVQSGSITWGSNSVTLADMVAKVNGSNVSVKFSNRQFTYIVWG